MPSHRFLCSAIRVHHTQYPEPFTGKYNPLAERMTPEDIVAYIAYAKRNPERYTGYDVESDDLRGIEIVEKVPDSDDLRVMRVLGLTMQDIWIG